ncbi:Fe-S cluster assembly protein HesB [Methanocalculus taiwanensis]|uniref:Fe-S cluster assembly protein HesB n=1 Tax=Methanocalculus taiwanensis TaxID=106207 RepID=A0ABD4TNS0_9EURY|nr:Fe-S cluster assembly protein HesB [Methanocalculus taiwanensis]MCQ1539500.1 Fe-S cluster assembly protein HesB [Methanocalculus taiwanensis]
MDNRKKILSIISILNERYGTLSWWDASFDGVVIGAILTQQTRWDNVERAFGKLKSAGIETLASVIATDPAILESCIRCTGFYRVKAHRLQNLAQFILGLDEDIKQIPTYELRKLLLTVKGVGEETADSILCYGLFRDTFVIDAYTRRICGCAEISASDDQLRSLFLSALSSDNALLRSCHGQIVEYAKEYCTKKRCPECIIQILNG